MFGLGQMITSAFQLVPSTTSNRGLKLVLACVGTRDQPLTMHPNAAWRGAGLGEEALRLYSRPSGVGASVEHQV